MPSVSLYRIADADLTDASMQSILTSDDVSDTEIPLKTGVAGRLTFFRGTPEVPEWVTYLRPIAAREIGISARETFGAVLLLQPDMRRRVIYAAAWGSGRF